MGDVLAFHSFMLPGSAGTAPSGLCRLIQFHQSSNQWRPASASGDGSTASRCSGRAGGGRLISALRCDEDNSLCIVKRICRSANTSAKRMRWRNCCSLKPRPNSAVNCCASSAITCLPYLARWPCCNSVLMCWPLCKYDRVSSACTALATRWRAVVMSWRTWASSEAVAWGLMLSLRPVCGWLSAIAAQHARDTSFKWKCRLWLRLWLFWVDRAEKGARHHGFELVNSGGVL